MGIVINTILAFNRDYWSAIKWQSDVIIWMWQRSQEAALSQSGFSGFEALSFRPLFPSVFWAIFISMSCLSWWPPDGYRNTRHHMIPPNQGIQELGHARIGIAVPPYLFRMGRSSLSTPLRYSLYLTSQDFIVCSLLEQFWSMRKRLSLTNEGQTWINS